MMSLFFSSFCPFSPFTLSRPSPAHICRRVCPDELGPARFLLILNSVMSFHVEALNDMVASGMELSKLKQHSDLNDQPAEVDFVHGISLHVSSS